ncbi:22432_t:CDS:2, partial [Gigaspora rosea]
LESSNQRIEITSTTIRLNSDNSTLDIFIEEVMNDYQNAGSQICIALNKFIEQSVHQNLF